MYHVDATSVGFRRGKAIVGSLEAFEMWIYVEEISKHLLERAYDKLYNLLIRDSITLQYYYYSLRSNLMLCKSLIRYC